MSKRVNLYWWSPPRMNLAASTNFGDEIGPFLVRRLTGREPVWIDPRRRSGLAGRFKRILVTTGSVLERCDERCDVWGAGIIRRSARLRPARFHAVRGEATREYVRRELGTNCTVIGDPALILPSLLPVRARKMYAFGIVPHYRHRDSVHSIARVSDEIKLIDVTTDVETVVGDINKCAAILSSSLHGMIVAHAYGIPALLFNCEPSLYGDGIKYVDYLTSVRIREYPVPVVSCERDLLSLFTARWSPQRVRPQTEVGEITESLLRAFPKRYLR